MIFYTHERNFGCRVTEFSYKGLRSLSLENELLRVSILADKGSDIYEFNFKPLDVDFMWRSPWGVRNPAHYVATTHTAVSSFLDFYEGGWQDCFPTGGNPAEYRGFTFGAHGETPTLPWDYRIEDDSPERISVRFSVRTVRTPFYIEKLVSLERGKPVLVIEEKITNEGRMRMELMWGQHPALGPPFIDDTCVIDLPSGRVHATELAPNTRFRDGVHSWPIVPGKYDESIDLRHVASAEADTSDTLRLDALPEGWYAITNTSRQVGFGMCWPLEVFPVLWFWQVYGGAYGPPWYGRNYNIALEPFSCVELTLPDAIQAGTAHLLEPGESLQARFLAVAYTGKAGITRVTPEGEVLREG
jgi:hypothetical protein